MSSVERFGGLAFNTITPDEVAKLTYFTVRFGLDHQDNLSVPTLTTQALTILGIPQLAIVLSAFDGETLTPAWAEFKAQLLARLDS